MAKKLKVWNGRGYCCFKYDDPRWKSSTPRITIHVNVCATSRADARRVIEEYCGITPSDGELKDFFSECWGDSMKGIEPERGLWIEFEKEIPEKVV